MGWGYPGYLGLRGYGGGLDGKDLWQEEPRLRVLGLHPVVPFPPFKGPLLESGPVGGELGEPSLAGSIPVIMKPALLSQV